MSRRAIVIFPTLPAEPIASLRRRYDPLAERLPPHLTLVFPFQSDLSPDNLRHHVEQAVLDSAPFPLRLAGVVGSENEYLFLGVKRGNDALIALHDRLYQGPLKAHLSSEQPFLPHLTLGHLAGPAALRVALADAASLDLTLETEAQTVTVYRITPSGERSLEAEVSLPEHLAGTTAGSLTVPTLTTPRLSLRPFTPADAPAVASLAGDPNVAATTLNLPHPYTLLDAERWISRQRGTANPGTGLDWAIVRRTDQALLGTVNLGIVARHSRGSLGYWLGVPFWNQGYMTEAVQAVVTYAFDVLGLYRVEAACFPRNRASARVMEKVGLRHEGQARRYLKKGGHFEDIARYARLRDDP